MRRRARQHPVLMGWLILCGLAIAGAPSSALAGDDGVEAWRSSPFHGAIDGATGQPIPCLCRYRDRDFRVGERACLQTPAGSYTARCDLNQNNTSWVPTGEPCLVSWRSERPQGTRLSAARKS